MIDMRASGRLAIFTCTANALIALASACLIIAGGPAAVLIPVAFFSCLIIAFVGGTRCMYLTRTALGQTSRSQVTRAESYAVWLAIACYFSSPAPVILGQAAMVARERHRESAGNEPTGVRLGRPTP